MAVVPSFSLFNLPFVPLKEVMNYIDPIDLFWFASLSKKTTKLVKETHTLDLVIISNRKCIACKNLNGSKFLTNVVEKIERTNLYQSNTISRNLGDMIVPTKFDNNSIITYWEDVFEGFKKMTSLVCNSFKIRNLSIECHGNGEEEFYKVVEHIQKLQSESSITLRKLNLHTYFHYGTMYKYILEKFSVVPELIMTSPEIKFQYNMDQPNGDSYIKVLRANWLTFEDIHLITKYKKITLWDLKWNSQEMNKFLKMWIDCTIMKNVRLYVTDVDLQEALEGLEVTPQRKYLSCVLLQPHLRDCSEIQRKDGVKANIFSLGKTSMMETFQ